MVDEEPWYSLLREQWKPDSVHLLLIAESAPDDRGDPTQRHFFYADHLGGADNLFRSVVQAMYGATKVDLKQRAVSGPGWSAFGPTASTSLTSPPTPSTRVHRKPHELESCERTSPAVSNEPTPSTRMRSSW